MYTAMKVGRERRLAYARQISLPYNSNREIRILGRNYNEAISSINLLYNFDSNFNSNFESNLDLQDIKIGLISKEILMNSTVKIKQFDYCTICQEDILVDIIRELKCKHCFHINCIDTWLIQSKKCPDCRFELKN